MIVDWFCVLIATVVCLPPSLCPRRKRARMPSLSPHQVGDSPREGVLSPRLPQARHKALGPQVACHCKKRPQTYLWKWGRYG